MATGPAGNLRCWAAGVRVGEDLGDAIRILNAFLETPRGRARPEADANRAGLYADVVRSIQRGVGDAKRCGGTDHWTREWEDNSIAVGRGAVDRAAATEAFLVLANVLGALHGRTGEVPRPVEAEEGRGSEAESVLRTLSRVPELEPSSCPESDDPVSSCDCRECIRASLIRAARKEGVGLRDIMDEYDHIDFREFFSPDELR